MDLPTDQRTTLDRIQTAVASDARFVGLAAGGSLLSGGMDAYSDLDLVVVVDDVAHESVMGDRAGIAGGWGALLAAFTGEHVGEPRLLICLYADPLMHVDLKFVSVDGLRDRVEDPVVLWERAGLVSAALTRSAPHEPAADPQGIEDRFWVWVHYGATKLGRGELFEVLEFLAFLRAAALAPLVSLADGGPGRGVRRLELSHPGYVTALAATNASYDAADCGAAILACVREYRGLRDRLGLPITRRDAAEAAAVEYLDQVTGAQHRV